MALLFLLASNFNILFRATWTDYVDSQHRPVKVAQPVKQVPSMRKWRINDTLTLECTRPQAKLIMKEQPTTSQTIWGQIALRGRRGSYRVLETKAYWTLYHAATSPEGNLFQLATVDIDANHIQVRAKTVKLSEKDLAYNTYDVRYQTWTQYLDENLIELPAQQVEAGFLGGEANDGIYYPLPHWLSQEQARLARTHSLPAVAQLDAYLELSQDTAEYTGRLVPAYRSILAGLLHAYQAYPLPPASSARLAQAVQSLTASHTYK